MMKINGRAIANGHKPYVIAEISANHNGELENALRLITLARNAGAEAVKIQTYTADTMTIECDRPEFKITGGLWDGYSLYQLYEQAHTPWEWHKPLFDKAREEGITLFSSPFDETAIDFLEDLNAPAYKIASFEAMDFPLIKYAAGTKKPLIISTGLATLAEIEELHDYLRTIDHQDYALLHCVSGYPTPVEQTNVLTLVDMQQRFNCITGLSDHSLGHAAAVTATALGAAIIEKHFTFARADGGPDAAFSLEPAELTELCQQVDNIHLARGTANYDRKHAEKSNLQFRRSIYVTQDVAAGGELTPENIARIRPGLGMPPRHYHDILGATVTQDLKAGTPLCWQMIKAMPEK